MNREAGCTFSHLGKKTPSHHWVNVSSYWTDHVPDLKGRLLGYLLAVAMKGYGDLVLWHP